MKKPAEAPVHPTPETLPVLVVGAGPTGLTAAMELSRMGVPVRLIDKKAAPSTTSRALAVQARTLELLQQRGLAGEMLRLGNQARATTLYSTHQRLAQVDLRKIPSRYNFVLLLSQAETERLLREQVERQGVPVEWNTELIALEQVGQAGQGGVRAVLRRPNGALEELPLSYLISAEGAHSAVRHTLNLPFPGKSLAQRYVLADLYLDGDLPDDEMSIFLGKNGLLAVFPMKNRHFRFIATDPEPHLQDAPDPTLEELQRLYDASACVPARLRDLTWSSRFRINSRMVDSLQEGRVFFGGDAAHIHSPAGGQGMNTGIQDMINLGWKLALVWHGRATPALLPTYGQERLPVIRGVVSTTEKATDLFNATNAVVHQLVTHALPVVLGSQYVQHLGAGVVSEVAANYRKSPLASTVHASGTLRAGDRLPDLDVATASAALVPLYSLLNPSCFTLLVVSGDQAVLPTDWQQQLHPWQELLAVHQVAPATELAGKAVGHTPALLLVRPDAYLALATTPDNWPALLAWLQHWLKV